jgi:molybdopterin converting factor small subunit
MLLSFTHTPVMIIKVIAFGIAKDIFGASIIETEPYDGASVGTLRNLLEQKYPKLKELATYMIAVNSEYAEPNVVLAPGDEVAIIPPVSGG